MTIETSRRWLSEVNLERFKAAFRPKPIPLGLFNVVIGRNGSGKSTLLEALQWLDTTMRRDAREASERYSGITDLINLRSQAEVPYFRLTLTWIGDSGQELPLRYELKVEAEGQPATPFIAEEKLSTIRHDGRPQTKYLTTTMRGERTVILPTAQTLTLKVPENLAVGFVSPTLFGTSEGARVFSSFQDFWFRAVFLRLNPNRLADGSLATRKSFEPLLDEEGQSLPALLNELTLVQKRELTQVIQEIFPDIKGVWVSRAEQGRDTRVNYGLTEQMPYRGRAGRSQFPIPSWMLSEGTRRITAIMALLVREPAPSLLCIEEIENGLDPWTIIKVLQHLQSAAERGTQVIVTTHSPWLLDHVPMDSILQVRRIEGDTQYEPFASREEIRAFSDSVPPGTRYVNEP